MAKVVGEFPDKLIAAHYRSDAEAGVEAIKELTYISWITSVPIQISHIGSCTAFGMMREGLQAMEQARKIGIDVMSDCYPYAAFSTFIGSAVFDEGCFERWGTDYSAIEPAEGEYRGQRCTRETFEYLRAHEPDTLVVAFVMNKDEVMEALVHPMVMVGSDGLMREGQGHPRAAGAFPRVFAHYVREREGLSLIDAILKMTLMPAERLGLKNKGKLTLGSDADITIFDPDKIVDRATYANPTTAPEGIPYVLVNGELVVDKGELTGVKPGKALRL